MLPSWLAASLAIAQPTPVLLWKTVKQPASKVVAIGHHKHLIAFGEYEHIDLWDDDQGAVLRSLATTYSFDELRFSKDDRALIGLDRGSANQGVRFGGSANVRVNVVRRDLRSGMDLAEYIIRPLVFDATLSEDGDRVATVDDQGWLTVYTSRGVPLDSIQLPGNDPGPRDYFPSKIVFNHGGKTLTAISRGHAYLVRFPKLTIDHEIVIGADSVQARAFEWFELDAGRIFLHWSTPRLVELPSGNLSKLQPVLPVRDRKSRVWTAQARLDDVLLLESGRLLISRYEATTWGIPIHGPGPRSGIDSLVFQDANFPQGFWNIHVSPGMKLHGELPWKKNGIFMSDGSTALVVYPDRRAIDTLASTPATMVGFVGDSSRVLLTSTDALQWRDAKSGRFTISDWLYNGGHPTISPDQRWIALHGSGQALEVRSASNQSLSRMRMNSSWESFFMDSDLILVYQNSREGSKFTSSLISYSVPTLSPIDSFPELTQYNSWRLANSFHSAGNNSMLITGGDTAFLFDWKKHSIERTFAAGVNSGLTASAISHNHQWVVTVNRYTNNAKLWGATDGSLKATFQLPKTGHVEFTPNDRYLLTVGYGGDDSCLTVVDPITGDQQAICGGHSGLRDFYLSRQGQYLGVSRADLAEVYVTPNSWTASDPLGPPKSYLPLRFYVPANARIARDTTGLPYAIPRTDIILELRYADGRVIKRILDGNFHSGKWHEFPKGSYIMHTEIGCVVKDERAELK